MQQTAAPQRSGTRGFAPLETLSSMALRRYGDMSTRRINGDIASLMVELANRVIDEVNMHPDREGQPTIKYYIGINDIREVHDTIVVDGLAAYYAGQQGSNKSGVLLNTFFRTLNQKLYEALAKGNPKVSIQPVEQSSNT